MLTYTQNHFCNFSDEWLADQQKAITKSCIIIGLASKFTFEVITTKLVSNEPTFFLQVVA